MQTNDKSLTRKAFWAMVHRDLLVQWRDKWEFVFRGAMIPVLILILLLTAAESAALGLLVGTIIKPSQIAAMFPGFLMPVVFLGAIFYTWKQLAPLPVMQVITLLDPLTWINEAIRALMTPSTPSLPLAVSAIGMVVWTAVMGLVAIKRFNKMVYNK